MATSSRLMSFSDLEKFEKLIAGGTLFVVRNEKEKKRSKNSVNATKVDTAEFESRNRRARVFFSSSFFREKLS